VAGEEVLAEIFAELLEEVAQPADHRVVAQHAVLLLRDVAHEEEHEDADDRERDERPDPVRQDVFRHCPPGVFPYGNDTPRCISSWVAERTVSITTEKRSAMPASGWLASSTTLPPATSVTV